MKVTPITQSAPKPRWTPEKAANDPKAKPIPNPVISPEVARLLDVKA